MKNEKDSGETFQNRKIDRRHVLKAATALSLAALGTPISFSNAAGVEPKKGGRFRYAVSGMSAGDSLDPALLLDAGPTMISWQTRNNLVEIDADYNAVPELAESMEPDDTAKTWAFKIRKGVEFHNGKSLDAEDVVFSLNHHRRDDSKSAAKSLLGQVEDIKVDGSHGVVFVLKSGNADFPFVLSDYHLQIVPKATRNFEDGLGTGAYVLQEFEPGVRSLAKRNPNYWKTGRGHFDEVESLGISDPGARTTALRTGAVDAISRPDRKVLTELEREDALRTLEVTGTTHMTLAMNTKAAPYESNDVRMALKYAIDREHLVATILKGRGVVGNDHPIAPVNRYHAADLPQRPYDPDKARYHLRQAGLENLSLQLHASDIILNSGVDVAMLYREHAAKAGIEIEVIREPADGYWTNVWNTKPWFQSYYSGRPTEDGMFSLTYLSDAAWNETKWANKDFDNLIISARAELDEAKRRELYFEAQALCSDEGGAIIPFFLNNIDVASRRVGYEKLASNFGMDGMRAPERWWFEA